MKTYKCSNCGAEVLFNEGDFTNCIYCGSSISIIRKEYFDYNIKKIIKFDIDKEEAVKRLRNAFDIPSEDRIDEVKKYYIPVRFLTFNFMLYADYDKIKYTNGNNEQTERKTTIISGEITDEAVINTDKFKNIIDFHTLGNIVRYDFDPVLLGDVSCDFTIKEEKEDMIMLANETVKKFGQKMIGDEFAKGINSMSHNVSNLSSEDFSTLIPVYFIKTHFGSFYAVSGCTNTAKQESNLIKFNKISIASTIFAIYLLVMGIWTTYYTMFIPFAILIFIAGITASSKYDLNSRSSTLDNVDFEIISDKYTDNEFDYSL